MDIYTISVFLYSDGKKNFFLLYLFIIISLFPGIMMAKRMEGEGRASEKSHVLFRKETTNIPDSEINK